MGSFGVWKYTKEDIDLIQMKVNKNSSPALVIYAISRGTLQIIMKETQRSLGLRTTICRSYKVLSHVWFEVTTFRVVETGMTTA